MPWAWPMRCTWAMKSAACMPVYPPNWLTWLLVASTSSGRCLDWANNKDARSTWGWAEHTDGVQDTPALRLRRLISRRYCMAAFLSLRVESRRATMTTARTPPLSPHCAPARHGQAWVAWWPGRPGPQAQTTGADDWACGAERHRTPCHRGPWATAQRAAIPGATAKVTEVTCRTIVAVRADTRPLNWRSSFCGMYGPLATLLCADESSISEAAVGRFSGLRHKPKGVGCMKGTARFPTASFGILCAARRPPEMATTQWTWWEIDRSTHFQESPKHVHRRKNVVPARLVAHPAPRQCGRTVQPLAGSADYLRHPVVGRSHHRTGSGHRRLYPGPAGPWRAQGTAGAGRSRPCFCQVAGATVSGSPGSAYGRGASGTDRRLFRPKKGEHHRQWHSAVVHADREDDRDPARSIPASSACGWRPLPVHLPAALSGAGGTAGMHGAECGAHRFRRSQPSTGIRVPVAAQLRAMDMWGSRMARCASHAARLFALRLRLRERFGNRIRPTAQSAPHPPGRRAGCARAAGCPGLR